MPRAIINVHSFLQDFNPSKFIVYTSLLVFSILLSLRLDNRITTSFWLVFLPLWIWKGIAIAGATIGTFVWLGNADYRTSNASYVHFKSMLISISLQLLLLMFEILVCDKLESRRHTWTLAFIPLIFVSLLSISVCVWSIKNGRGIELEFFIAANILQFILLALKLDNFITWSWMVVFIPSWILLCFVVVVILYAMIFAALLLRSPNSGSEQRRASIYSASSWSMIFLPLSMFMVVLASKLDSGPNIPTPSYLFTFLPLFLTLLILIRLSFGSKPGSLWWFGMRSDFCTFLLTICPCLQQYGNTSFVMSRRFSDTVADIGDMGDSQNRRTPSNEPIPSLFSTNNTGSNLERQAHEYQPEGGPKRLLHSISKVFFRDKNLQEIIDEESRQDALATKLDIETPD